VKIPSIFSNERHKKKNRIQQSAIKNQHHLAGCALLFFFFYIVPIRAVIKEYECQNDEIALFLL